MFGRDGRVMSGAEFRELVERNSYRPEIRWLKNRTGRYQGVPSDLCTMMIGPGADGRAHNVPSDSIPEYSWYTKDGRVRARGWRWLLRVLLNGRVIRPCEEVRKWLGDQDFDTYRPPGCY